MVRLVVAAVILVTAGLAQAEAPNDVTLFGLGPNMQSYSDTKGNTGTITQYGNGLSGYIITTPDGQIQTGSIMSLQPTQIKPAPLPEERERPRHRHRCTPRMHLNGEC